MAYNTIKIKNYSNICEEYAIVAAATPGHLLELTSAGKVQKASAEGGNVLPMFLCEDELRGKGIDDAVAANDQVQVWIPNRGDIVYALLADGENVAIGDYLSSKGDGQLKKYVLASSAAIIEYPEVVVGQALEAVNMSTSTDPSGRIKVRIH